MVRFMHTRVCAVNPIFNVILTCWNHLTAACVTVKLGALKPLWGSITLQKPAACFDFSGDSGECHCNVRYNGTLQSHSFIQNKRQLFAR